MRRLGPVVGLVLVLVLGACGDEPERFEHPELARIRADGLVCGTEKTVRIDFARGQHGSVLQSEATRAPWAVGRWVPGLIDSDDRAVDGVWRLLDSAERPRELWVDKRSDGIVLNRFIVEDGGAKSLFFFCTIP